MTFDDLGLSPNLLAAIKDAGYTTPTPIQAGAIPVALTGRDVLGIAQTGTGKTASFTLPLIERLSRGRARARMPRSLILCPTRELADQVAQNVRTYAKNHKLTMALLIGGVAFAPQKEILDKGADILIATPGRLLDHFGRGGLMLMGIEIMSGWCSRLAISSALREAPMLSVPSPVGDLASAARRSDHFHASTRRCGRPPASSAARRSPAGRLAASAVSNAESWGITPIRLPLQ